MKPLSSKLARFIPREEIDGFSAWQFGSVDGGDDLPRSPSDEAEGEPQEAFDEERVEAIRQQARAEGFSQGHDAGARETREAMEAAIRRTAEETGIRMAQLLHGMREQLQRSEEMISRQLLELACDLARQVVRQELRSPTAHLAPVVSEAVSQLVDDGLPATVRLHPDDLAQLRDGMASVLGAHPVELVEDASLTPGGCLVESPSTTVDASIEKRWARAIGNLGLDVAWNPEDGDV